MNSLPPLRTVRQTVTPPPVASGLGQTPPPRPSFGPEYAALPSAARAFVADVVAAQLLPNSAVTAFVAKLGTRVNQIPTRECTADALVGLGFLTRYQASRMLAGQPHGLVFGSYRVLDRIGSGSVGVVFLAEHAFLGRQAAIKVVPADDATPSAVYDRFLAEMRLLASIDHPHVAAAHDAGVLPASSGGQSALAYLVLDYIRGGDLEQYVVDRGPQPVGLVCEWGRQIASALRATHAVGLVHRDVKPSNLLLTEIRRMKLIDFGLAREFASTRTDPRSLLGSLDFLAPEQLADASTVGPAADVYGLGATLFWVLTGHTPYPKTRSAAATVVQMQTSQPRHVREFRAELPAELDEWIARMLARNPTERPTPAAIAAAMAKFAVPSSHPSQDDAMLVSDDDTEAGALRSVVRELEDLTEAARRETATARAAVLTTLAAVTATRSGQSPPQSARLTAYVRALAPALARHPDWSMLADPVAVNDYARSVAALDLGTIGISDDVLTAAEPRTPSDRFAFESHTIRGADLLDELGRQHGPALPFLRVLRAVVCHHHERWDGTGYPDHLRAETIPLGGRIAAVVDGYDRLRRGSVAHADAVRQIAKQSGTAFDPVVVEAFRAIHEQFEQTYRVSTGEELTFAFDEEPAKPHLSDGSNSTR